MLKLKSVVLTIIILSIIISGSFFVFATSGEEANLMIANQSMDQIKRDDRKAILETAVTSWLESGPLILQSEYERIEVPRTLFSFDIDQTLTNFQDRIKRGFSTLFLKKKHVHIPMKVTIEDKAAFMDMLPSYIDKQTTLEYALLIASQLEESIVNISYINEETLPQPEITKHQVAIPVSDSEAVLDHLINKLDNQRINPKDYFSFLGNLTLPESVNKTSTNEKSFLGSALYALTLKTNLQISERHQQIAPPDYLQPGLDVDINEAKDKDFVIYNPNDVVYTIHAKKEGNQLILSFHSLEQANTYEYEVEEVEEVKPRTIYRFSHQLPAEKQETLFAGRNGVKVNVYKQSTSGREEERERMSTDFYPPVPKIILVSTREPIIEEEIDIKEDESSGLFDEEFVSLLEEFLPQEQENNDPANLSEEELEALIEKVIDQYLQKKQETKQPNDDANEEEEKQVKK